MKKYLVVLVPLLFSLFSCNFFSEPSMKGKLHKKGGEYRFKASNGEEFRYYTISDIIAYNIEMESNLQTEEEVDSSTHTIDNTNSKPSSSYLSRCTELANIFDCTCPPIGATDEEKIQYQLACSRLINGDPTKCRPDVFWEGIAALKLINDGEYNILNARIINIPDITILGNFSKGRELITFPSVLDIRGKRELAFEVEFDDNRRLSHPFKLDGD
ncbi:MAG: hypothetical protein AAGA77_23035 [Bacteroidota bacterium]